MLVICYQIHTLGLFPFAGRHYSLKKNFDTFTMRLSIPNKDFGTRDYQFMFSCIPSADLLLLLQGGPDIVIANIKV